MLSGKGLLPPPPVYYSDINFSFPSLPLFCFHQALPILYSPSPFWKQFILKTVYLHLLTLLQTLLIHINQNVAVCLCHRRNPSLIFQILRFCLQPAEPSEAFTSRQVVFPGAPARFVVIKALTEVDPADRLPASKATQIINGKGKALLPDAPEVLLTAYFSLYHIPESSVFPGFSASPWVNTPSLRYGLISPSSYLSFPGNFLRRSENQITGFDRLPDFLSSKSTSSSLTALPKQAPDLSSSHNRKAPILNIPHLSVQEPDPILTSSSPVDRTATFHGLKPGTCTTPALPCSRLRRRTNPGSRLGDYNPRFLHLLPEARCISPYGNIFRQGNLICSGTVHCILPSPWHLGPSGTICRSAI